MIDHRCEMALNQQCSILYRYRTESGPYVYVDSNRKTYNTPRNFKLRIHQGTISKEEEGKLWRKRPICEECNNRRFNTDKCLLEHKTFYHHQTDHISDEEVNDIPAIEHGCRGQNLTCLLLIKLEENGEIRYIDSQSKLYPTIEDFRRCTNIMGDQREEKNSKVIELAKQF